MTDDGRGRPRVGAGGQGLSGMRERAAVYGGELEAGPAPDGGWRVRTRLGERGVITVLLADDQPLLRAGFRMILDAQPDIEVAGEAADGEQAVQQTAALDPDVVLMDVRMPGTDGIEATRRIVASGSPARVLILTTFDLDEYAFSGLRAARAGSCSRTCRRRSCWRASAPSRAGTRSWRRASPAGCSDAYAHQFPDAHAAATRDERLDPLTDARARGAAGGGRRALERRDRRSGSWSRRRR